MLSLLCCLTANIRFKRNDQGGIKRFLNKWKLFTQRSRSRKDAHLISVNERAVSQVVEDIELANQELAEYEVCKVGTICLSSVSVLLYLSHD